MHTTAERLPEGRGPTFSFSPVCHAICMTGHQDRHSPGLSAQALTLLADGQVGYWPLARRPDLHCGRVVWVSDVEAVLSQLGRADFITSTPFRRQDRKKACLVGETNVCRGDIDPPKDLPEREQALFVQEAVERLTACVGDPSWVIDSGRGVWWWFKLSAMVPVADAERLSRLIAQVAGSTDLGSWSCAQFTRLPGSRNEKTGRVSKVLDVSGRRFDPGVLEASLRGALSVEPEVPRAAPGTPRLVSAEGLLLRAEFWDYIRGDWDAQDTVARFGRTRSEIEQSIFVSLARQGRSADVIHEFAEANGLSKYIGAGESYQKTSVRKAVEFVQEAPWDDGSRVFTKSFVTNERAATVTAPREQDQLLAQKVLQAIDGKTLPSVLYQDASTQLAVSQRTVIRQVRELQEDGYVAPTQRGVPLRRTALGDTAAGKKFLTGKMAWRDVRRRQALGRHGTRPHGTAPRRAPMAVERTRRLGVQAEVRRRRRERKRHSYDGRYRISFFEHKRRVHFLQLLTPPDQIVGAHLREQLAVDWEPPVAGFSLPVLANFASVPDDPDDQVAAAFDRFDAAPPGMHRALAVGVLLDGTGSWEPLYEHEPDANGELRPLAGLIVEGDAFWSRIVECSPDWEGMVIRVKRTGEYRAKHFETAAVAEAPPLDLHGLPDLPTYMHEIGDAERAQRLLAGLPLHWRFY